MSARPCSWVIPLLVCCTWPAAAADRNSEELEVELFFAPAETVSSAARHDQPCELSPSAITVLTRHDIEASGARNLPEVLRLVPNMDVHAVKPMWYIVGARSVSSISSDTMLLLVDGRDLTQEVFGFPLWTMLPFSMDEVERIEVIRGPGSALYGANAYAGVVHVITRRPDRDPATSVSLRGGEHGFTEVSASANRTFGKLALGVHAGAERQDLWSAPDTRGIETLRGRVVGKLELGADTGLEVEAGAFSSRGRFFTNIGEATVHAGSSFYARSRLTRGDLDIHAYYDRAHIDADFGLVLDYQGMTLAEVPRTVATVDKLALQAQHAVELAHNRITYGAEWIMGRYRAATFVDPEHFEHRLGLYLQDELDLGRILHDAWELDVPALILTAGLRFDYNSVTAYELSPRAALVVAPHPAHHLRLGYAHAFLKPTFFESSLRIHLDSAFGFDELDMSNPDLDNETIDSLELGYHGEFLDGALSLDADFALNWYRGTITFDYDTEQMGTIRIGSFSVPDLNGPGFEFYNLPHGRDGHALEIRLVTRPADLLRLFAQAGYRQLFRTDTGAFESDEPVFNLAAGIDLGSTDSWSLSLRAHGTSEHTIFFRGPGGALDPNVVQTLPAHWLLNARLACTLSRSPSRLEAGLEAFNLLDFRFREFGGVARPGEPDFGAERLGRRVVLFLRGSI